MSTTSQVLQTVMRETGTTQSSLSRLSGVRQPTISQILSGRIGVSDEQLGRSPSCMGYELRVVREPVKATLTRSESRSWRLHRQISSGLDRDSLSQWTPRLRKNLTRLRSQVRGEPHTSNFEHWRELVDDKDMLGLHRVLTGLDRHSIEMREVSPFGGVLSQEERQRVLKQAG